MKLIIDVSYQDTQAKVVGGFFKEWSDESFLKKTSRTVDNVNEYTSGEFYKRELPCIMKFIEEIPIEEIELIIIDGYIYLDNERKKGLGAYLYESLNSKIPIIGVAKSRFYNNNKFVEEIFRGKSKKSLFISAVGIDLANSSILIQKMFGEFRLPNLIKQIDTETKNI